MVWRRRTDEALLTMNENGIWDKGPHRRVTFAPLTAMYQWAITLPAAVEGHDAEIKHSAFVAWPNPKPIGEGVFSVPGVQLWLDSGGTLVGSVEFWGEGGYLLGAGAPDDSVGIDGNYYLNTDDMEYWGPKGETTEETWDDTGPTALPEPDGGNEWILGSGSPHDGADGDYWFDKHASAWYGPKADGTWDDTGPHTLPDPGETLISETDLQTLSATLPPLQFADYGLVGDDISADTTAIETVYSDWVDIGVIPAGSGILMNGGLAGNVGARINMTPADGIKDGAGSASVSLELGDADEGIVATLDLLSANASFDTGQVWLSGTTVPAAGLGNIGDFYTRTTTGFWYGPKTISGWGTAKDPWVNPPPANNYTCSVGKSDLAKNGQLISWGDDVAKVRVKLVVSAATNCDIGGTVGNLGLRRFYQ
jgi:hypothetical protein